MERVFYKVHDKVTKLTLCKSTPNQRTLIENTILFFAVISFSIVIVCHRTFVYRGGAIKSQAMNSNGWNIPSVCLKSINGFEESVDVTHIVIYDYGDYGDYGDAGEKEELVKGEGYGKESNHHDGDEIDGICCSRYEWMNENATFDSYQRTSDNYDIESFPNQSFVISIEPLTGKKQLIMNTSTESEFNNSNNAAATPNKHLSIYNTITSENITYSFSTNQGFLSLPPQSLFQRNISSQYVIIHTHDKHCFGDDPLLTYLGQSYGGIRETIALNWILGFWNGSGHILHMRNGMMIDLSEYLNEYSFRWPTTTTTSSTTATAAYKTRWHHNFLIFKIGVLLSSLFLFFTTTTLVSFTLRETQDRMVRFTIQLQLQIRNRQPYGGLIFTHVIENMVFVPIMIGIIFFLTDCCYNGDKFLAFVILSGVWICEVFSAIRYVVLCGIRKSVFFHLTSFYSFILLQHEDYTFKYILPSSLLRILYIISHLLLFMSFRIYLHSITINCIVPITFHDLLLESI